MNMKSKQNVFKAIQRVLIQIEFRPYFPQQFQVWVSQFFAANFLIFCFIFE